MEPTESKSATETFPRSVDPNAIQAFLSFCSYEQEQRSTRLVGMQNVLLAICLSSIIATIGIAGAMSMQAPLDLQLVRHFVYAVSCLVFAILVSSVSCIIDGELASKRLRHLLTFWATDPGLGQQQELDRKLQVLLDNAKLKKSRKNALSVLLAAISWLLLLAGLWEVLKTVTGG